MITTKELLFDFTRKIYWYSKPNNYKLNSWFSELFLEFTSSEIKGFRINTEFLNYTLKYTKKKTKWYHKSFSSKIYYEKTSSEISASIMKSVRFTWNIVFVVFCLCCAFIHLTLKVRLISAVRNYLYKCRKKLSTARLFRFSFFIYIVFLLLYEEFFSHIYWNNYKCCMSCRWRMRFRHTGL